MIELIEKRQENSKTLDLGNGKRQLLLSVGAIHYKDAEGKWQDVDEGYSDPDTAVFDRKYNKLPYGLRLSDDSTRRIYPDRNDQSYWLEFGKILPDMGLPERVKKEVWRWKHGTYDSQIIIDGARVKLNIILKTPAAPISFTIPFILNGLTRDGLVFRHNGKLAGLIRKPVATDAEENKREVTITFEAGQIILNLDTTGLVYPIQIDPTWQVGSSDNDCDLAWVYSNWVFNLTYSYVEVGFDDANHLKYGSGMRFVDVAIPRGATITTAHLTITARLADSKDVVRSVIIGEDTDNATVFSDKANYQGRRGTVVGGASDDNITSASVNWDSIASWIIDTEYNSPEIKTIIQEIINRGGWSSGNSLVVFWDDHAGRTSAVFETYRRGYSWDLSPALAPKLVIEFTPPAPPELENKSANMGSKMVAAGLI